MNKIKKSITTIITLLSTSIFCCVQASAIQNSQLATGTTNLIKDLTSWLTGIALTVTICIVIYLCIRRAAADEQDKKMWDKRIVTSVISGIGAVLASSIINLIAGYYGQ